jgi:hypothetical protein
VLLALPISYEVVFDVAESGYRYWTHPLLALAITAFVAIVLGRGGRPRSRLLGTVALVAGTFIAVVVFALTFKSYQVLRRALDEGRYVTVEGTVISVRPGDRAGNREEVVTVSSGGREYRYAFSHSRLTGGFDRISARGGPLRVGTRVRIADVQGIIARLEVRNDSSTEP